MQYSDDHISSSKTLCVIVKNCLVIVYLVIIYRRQYRTRIRGRRSLLRRRSRGELQPLLCTRQAKILPPCKLNLANLIIQVTHGQASYTCKITPLDTQSQFYLQAQYFILYQSSLLRVTQRIVERLLKVPSRALNLVQVR